MDIGQIFLGLVAFCIGLGLFGILIEFVEGFFQGSSNSTVTYDIYTIKKSWVGTTTKLTLTSDLEVTALNLGRAKKQAVTSLHKANAELETTSRHVSREMAEVRRRIDHTLFFTGKNEQILADLCHSRDTIRDAIAHNRKEIKRVNALTPGNAAPVFGSHVVYTIDGQREIYIGITNDFERRCKEHLGGSHNEGVNKLIASGARPTVIASGLSLEDASRIESDTIATMRRSSKTVHNIAS